MCEAVNKCVFVYLVYFQRVLNLYVIAFFFSTHLVNKALIFKIILMDFLSVIKKKVKTVLLERF